MELWRRKKRKSMHKNQRGKNIVGNFGRVWYNIDVNYLTRAKAKKKIKQSKKD